MTGGFTKRKIVFGICSICSTMKARKALVLGMLLLLAGAFLYAFSGVVVTVYAVSSGSYWTYYEYQYATHNEYQCRHILLGTGPLCTFFYYLAYGGAGAFFFTGAAMMAVSFYRLIECPRTLPPAPAPLRYCHKCGTINPSTSKYCSECATKLA